MTDNEDKIQRDSEKKAKDHSLWAYMTRDVEPLKGQKPDIGTKEVQKKPVLRNRSVNTENIIPPVKRAKQKAQIDARTAERLRKGQIPIEGRLDLHGMTREKAYEALCGFITRSQAQGLRCVLVITGKGARGPLEPEVGVLKQHTPEWLSTPPLEHFVLKVQTAKPKDGGSGAVYVLLRRAR